MLDIVSEQFSVDLLFTEPTQQWVKGNSFHHPDAAGNGVIIFIDNMDLESINNQECYKGTGLGCLENVLISFKRRPHIPRAQSRAKSVVPEFREYPQLAIPKFVNPTRV